jgi:hypothetical protein
LTSRRNTPEVGIVFCPAVAGRKVGETEAVSVETTDLVAVMVGMVAPPQFMVAVVTKLKALTMSPEKVIGPWMVGGL